MSAKITDLSSYARRKARGLRAFTVFLDEEHSRKIKTLAAANGLTLGQLINHWVDNSNGIVTLNCPKQQKTITK